MDVDLSFRTNGSVVLSERGEKIKPSGGWDSTVLIDAEADGLEVRVGIRGDDESGEDTLFFELSAYHMETDETARVFHADMEAHVSVDDMRKLHSFLGFILATR